MAAYDDLADEYYDAARHPTVAALRAASVAAIQALHPVSPSRGWTAEVGAGRSVTVEPALSTLFDPSRVVAVDESERMLRHTPRGTTARVVADALALPFRDGSVGMVLAVLGDPYNTRDLWAEVARVLGADGTVVYTAPSAEWAWPYRDAEGVPRTTSRFETRHHSTVDATSLIYDEPTQTAMIRRAGLRVENVVTVPLRNLPLPPPKARLVLREDEPFVRAWLARRDL